MRKHKIVLAEEDGYRFLALTPGDHDDGIVDKNPKADLEGLVRLCDQDAENCNAHDYVGAHRLLGAVLFRHVGRKKATAIMREIAERQGLHSMNGLCGRDSSFADLGVGRDGYDWDGRYGEGK